MKKFRLKKKISDKVIDRLTLYHCMLVDYMFDEKTHISSKKMADLLRIDDSQVRKDISLLNNPGKCRVGYHVRSLKESIESLLGFSDIKKVIIVGAGGMGSSLAKYKNFTNYGVNIIALFDNNPKLIGTKINEKPILNVDDLKDFVHKNGVHAAVLTVPRTAAKEIADIIIDSGIKYIWNFAPIVIEVPEDIKVYNTNLMGQVLQFTHNMGLPIKLK